MREAAIAAGRETDTSEMRYLSMGASYEALHPEATGFFNGFTMEELTA